MALVVVAVERPLDLIGVDNGRLDPRLLVPVGPRGQLHHLAARAWFSLTRAAQVAGWSLTYTYGGTYRPLGDQELLFHQRYTTTVLPGRPTKHWNGDTWYQLPGTAAASTPGASNHGLGLAIDMALGPDPAHATSITPALDWLSEHAPRFGFSWELIDEPWHVRYVTGDRIPQAVIDFEPHDPNPPEDDDMQKAIFVGDGARQGLWLPGNPIQAFENTDQRDTILAYLEIDPNHGLTVSAGQFDRLS